MTKRKKSVTFSQDIVKKMGVAMFDSLFSAVGRYVSHWPVILLLLLAPAVWSAEGAAVFQPEDYIVVSGATSPRVAYAVRQEGGDFLLALEVQPLAADGTGTSVNVGVAAAQTLLLTDADATVTRGKEMALYLFTVPATKIVTNDADWARLRLGIAVAWGGGALGADRQRERYLHLNSASAHAGLSKNKLDWAPLDLTEYATLIADRKSRITINFTQPMDGKASIIIEDAKGNRIRNLISGQSFSKGKHNVVWDGLDEQGNVVAPGAFLWRSINHPGITPDYQFAFCNDAGPNHSCFNAATASKDLVFFGAPITEGGYALMSIDATGTVQQTFRPLMGTGIEKVALAVDDQYLYVAHDGSPWGNTPIKLLSITRFNLKNGQSVDFPGGKRYVEISNRPTKDGKMLDLGGLAYLDGKLYLSSRLNNALLVLDAATCAKVSEIKLDAPGTLCVDGKNLLAVAGATVTRVDLVKNVVTTIVPAGIISPQGIAVDAKGTIYISDSETNTVKVFTATGELVKTLGKPGGLLAGPYDSERMVNPRGLAIAPNGWLWVTEERWTPKRYVAWDTATGKVAAEKFGPTSYGAGGAGFDSADASNWVGLGTQWKLDIAKKTAVPKSVLGSAFGATHYKYLHKDGRTFLIGFSGYTTIGELLPDGSVKDLACIASVHRFSFGMDWNPPQAFIDAFNAAYPTRIGKHSDKGPGMLWVDKNGDGKMDADEFTFSTAVDNFAGAYWGHDQYDLTLRLPAMVKGKSVMAVMKPDGYYPGGAPKYPTLNEACLAGIPISLGYCEVETTVDHFGNLLVNSDPNMTSFAPDGTLRWTFPNRWTNVQGSQQAPLPETGVMQGALFFLGTAPLDDKADVFMMNGNHGRFYVLTSDGFYLDEMFKDVRLGGAWDNYMIGGECFGGFFGKAADGNYYLQSGGIEYRIFKLNGLDKVKRAQGMQWVTAAQVAAAERSRMKQVVATTDPKTAEIMTAAKAPKIGDNDNNWPAAPTARWVKGQYTVDTRVSYDAENLYLNYLVKDPSPWKNTGQDWTMLFKTGDSIDMQLGTNPDTNPSRTGPVLGDLRLLIAPFNGENIAVLYQHRLPAATDGVTFTSPWRSERVDSVKRLTTARIAVKVERGQYRVEAAIPLVELGFKPIPGKSYRVDFGALGGDDDGMITLLRAYWSNQFTGLVNDVPGEIMLTPTAWGTVEFK